MLLKQNLMNLGVAAKKPLLGFLGLMRSLDLEPWTRIGAMNRRARAWSRQRLGVRWARGEGTHRFGWGGAQPSQSGVSPVPRQPPHSKTLRQFGRFTVSLDRSRIAHCDHEPGAQTFFSAWLLPNPRADKNVRAPKRFTGRSRLRGGFSVTELLVAVALMGIIVFALYSTFHQTQRALRANVTQVDVMESGRAAMEMITRELEQLTASAPTANRNLSASLGVTRSTPPTRISPVVQVEAKKALRTNVLQQFFFLNHINNQWVGTGYHVEDTNGLGVGALERFSTTVHESGFRTNDLYTAFLTNALSTDDVSRRTFHHLADGIIHLRLLAYDTNGVLLSFNYDRAIGLGRTNYTMWAGMEGGLKVTKLWMGQPVGTPKPPPHTNPPPNAIFGEESFNKARETQFVFLSNALPAYLELELGVLEPEALKQYNALRQAPVPAASDFLRNQAHRVHLFRKRIPIRSAPQ